jgi:hypothetical protein
MVCGAVEDALMETPRTPDRVWRAMRAAAAG